MVGPPSRLARNAGAMWARNVALPDGWDAVALTFAEPVVDQQWPRDFAALDASPGIAVSKWASGPRRYRYQLHFRCLSSWASLC
jgi:hypothetical protein